MTLLITVLAAIAVSVIWYTRPESGLRFGTLALMYWGAALMWFVDAVVEYIEAGAEYFVPAPADMLNDAFLGISAAALGLIIWLVIVLVKDPRGVIRKKLSANE